MVKPDIYRGKPYIETEKTDIGGEIVDGKRLKSALMRIFRVKTANHVIALYETFSTKQIFGRMDVMEVTGIKESRASEILKDLLEHDIIEPVSGHGKGKYRFR